MLLKGLVIALYFSNTFPKCILENVSAKNPQKHILSIIQTLSAYFIHKYIIIR